MEVREDKATVNSKSDHIRLVEKRYCEALINPVAPAVGQEKNQGRGGNFVFEGG